MSIRARLRFGLASLFRSSCDRTSRCHGPFAELLESRIAPAGLLPGTKATPAAAAMADLLVVASGPGGANSGTDAPASIVIVGSFPHPEISITVTGPDGAVAGTDVSYTVTIANHGTANAQYLSLIDDLSQGLGASLSFVAQSQVSGPAFHLQQFGGSILDRIDTLAVNDSATFKIDARVLSAVPDGTVVTNSVETNQTNQVATASTTVHAVADLALKLTGPAGPVIAGAVADYTLDLTNLGSSDALGVSFTNLLPAHTQLADLNVPGGWNTGLGNNGVFLTNGRVPAGSTVHLTVGLKLDSDVAAGSVLTETATVSTSTPDANAANNTASLSSPVSVQAALSVTITAPPIVPRDSFLTYTIHVTNSGPSDAQGVSLTDPLPAGVTVDDISVPPGWLESHPVSGKGTVSFFDGVVGGGETADLTVTVLTDPGATDTTITNAVNVLTSTPESGLTSHASSVSTSIRHGIDLRVVTFESGSTVLTAGEEHTFPLTFANEGDVAASGATFSVTVPANTVFDAAHSSPEWDLKDGAAAGTIGHLAPGTLSSHEQVGLNFAVRVLPVIPNNQDTVSLTAAIQGDGAHGSDIDPSNNTITVKDFLGIEPNLTLTSSQDVTYEATRGAVVHYQLTYQNIGNQDAMDVGLREFAEANVTFNAAESSSGWVLHDGVYEYVIGSVAAGAPPRSVIFAVITAPDYTGTTVFESGTISGSNATLHPTELATTLYRGIYAVATGVSSPHQAPVGSVKVFDTATGHELYQFEPYGPHYRDSIRIAIGDFNGDGYDDLVTATRTGTGQVRVFDGLTGQPLSGFAQIDPFDGRHQHGAYVAAGDVTGDGIPDIVVGSALGGGQVKIYNGRTESLVTSYAPFGPHFTGGVRVAVAPQQTSPGNVVAVTNYGAGLIKEFAGTTNHATFSQAVGGPHYRGGLSIAVGDLDNDGIFDLIIGQNVGRGLVEVLSGDTGDLMNLVNPFGRNALGGVRVAAGDMNGDTIADLIVASGAQGNSRVEILDGLSGAVIGDFKAFPTSPGSAVFVAATTQVSAPRHNSPT